MTTPIVYHPGTYGTYLEWCLTVLSGQQQLDQLPFTDIGASHKFIGNDVMDFDGWCQLLRTDVLPQFARFHPKTSQDQQLTRTLEHVIAQTGKIIYLYPSADSRLLSINNYYSKVWGDWWQNRLIHNVSQDVIYNNWPVSRSVPIDQIPIWIRREFLSYHFFDAWHDMVEWGHLNSWQDSRCLVIFVDQLLFDFESTLDSIQNFCNLHYQCPAADLIPAHQKNLRLQQHLGQDQLCDNIVNSVLDKNFLEWPALPLISEAWIQYQLRQKGWMLRCHGLDSFPTNSVQLAELTHKL